MNVVICGELYYQTCYSWCRINSFPTFGLINKKKSVKSKKIISNEASFESIVVDMSSVLFLSDVIVTATGLDVISPRAAGLTSLQARDR